MVDKLEVASLQKQIAAHRSTLNVYLEQLALHGRANVPAYIINEIRDARSEIQQKKIYLRSMGIPVDDQQNDFEEIVDVKGFQEDRKYKVQVMLYHDICKALQAVVFAGDDLWRRVDLENLYAFRKSVHNVRYIIEENAIYFEEEDIRELRQVVGIFEQYIEGKHSIVHDILCNYIPGFVQLPLEREIEWEIERLTYDNGRYKKRYDELVEKIRMSFKARISD